MLVKPEQSARWYLPDGSPFCRVEMKTKPGQFRRPYVREAAKAGAVPSVTSVLKVIASPGLERWKQEQVLQSALTLPRAEGESLDDFARRAADDARRQAEEAAEYGTRIHEAVEEWVVTGRVPDGELAAPVEAFAAWWDTAPLGHLDAIATEEAFVGQGYGGRRDIRVVSGDQVAVIDIKTKTGPGWQVNPEKEFKKIKSKLLWPVQLAAYALPLVSPDRPRRINVILTPSGLCHAHEWLREEFFRDVETFQAALAIWRNMNQWKKYHDDTETE